MDPLQRKMVESLISALQSTLGEVQTGERRSRYALFLPTYKGLDGKEVDNPKAWWIEAPGKKRVLGGGQEIISGGIGQDCMIFHVGQVVEIPHGKGGDRIIQYITETPDKACQFLLFTAPTPESAASEINRSADVLHLSADQWIEMRNEDTGNINDWKKVRDAIRTGVKSQKRAAVRRSKDSKAA